MTGWTNTRCGSENGSLIVIGGTNRPSSARENTIWINTSAAISSWVLSVEEPSSSEEGMVWIMQWQPTDKILTFDETFVVKIGGAKQYLSGSWTDMSGAVYLDGLWTNLQTYLYHEGSYNSIFPHTVPSNANMYTEESDHLHFQGVSQSTAHVYWERVDLTGVNAIKLDVERIRGSDIAYTRFGLCISPLNSSWNNIYDLRTAGYVWLGTDASAARTTYSIDVSDLVGKYYITFVNYAAGTNTTGGGQANVYNIELA